MSSSPIGIAVIGAGAWGTRLMAAAQRTPAIKLITCYNRNPESRAESAQKFGCEVASSLEEAIDRDDVQGVLLVTPNHVHAEQAEVCAQHGKHIFVEKPIANTREDAARIQVAAEAAKVVVSVGHSFRRLGAARKVKSLIEDGRLGQVVLAEANFSLAGRLTPDRWRYYRDTCPGGPLMQLGVHHADTLQYWLGPVTSVHGTFTRLATEAEIDDVASAQLRFESGATGTLNSSYVSPKTYDLRLYGTEAVLDYHTDMSIWPQAERMDSVTTLTLRTKKGSEPVLFEQRDMLVDELNEFAACIRGETVPETGPSEALRALNVVLGAIKSHEASQVVSI